MRSTLIYEHIANIANHPGKNDKIKLIGNMCDEIPESIRVLDYALNPHIIFGIIPKYDWIVNVDGGRDFNDDTLKLLDDIAGRMLTGHAARDAIIDELSELNNPSSILLVDIIKKNLRAGFSSTSVNKVVKGLIPEYAYMRCSTLSSIKVDNFDWEKGVISQCLDYNWELLADDGKKYKIGDIVENKLKLNVLSYENDKLTFKPITSYFENEIQENDEWYTISYYKDGEVITTPPLTDNHKVILEDGREVYVRDLQSGDFLRLSTIASDCPNVTK